MKAHKKIGVRDKKTGRYQQMIDHSGVEYIKKNISNKRGSSIKIAEFISKKYKVSFLYAYNFISRIKNERQG